jgi:hypothetical protein
VVGLYCRVDLFVFIYLDQTAHSAFVVTIKMLETRVAVENENANDGDEIEKLKWDSNEIANFVGLEAGLFGFENCI